MSRDFYPTRGRPRSFAELRKLMTFGGPQYEFMKWMARADYMRLEDDFTDDTLNTFWTAVANGGGASAASPVIGVAEDGVMSFVTGTAGDDTASSSMISTADWRGDRQSEVNFGFILPAAITECRLEMGFADVVPGSNKSVINSLVTPTVNTSVVDAAIFVYDHTGSTTTTEFVTIGTALSAAKTAYSPGTAWAANDYHEVRIALGGVAGTGNKAECWVDGNRVGHQSADSVEGGSALAIWIRLAASNGTSKTGKVDYVFAGKERKRA